MNRQLLLPVLLIAPLGLWLFYNYVLPPILMSFVYLNAKDIVIAGAILAIFLSAAVGFAMLIRRVGRGEKL